MKASDLLVKALENENVEYIFGIPGEENLDFLESLRKSSIQLILTRHEQTAGFMAAMYGRLTNKVGVCMSTLGPGATNLTTAAAFAQLGGMPLCIITGQKPIKKSNQGLFQIIDIVELMRPLTKTTERIIVGNQVPSLVRNAFRTALEERQGTVHLELPEDVAQESCDSYTIKVNELVEPQASQQSLNDAIELIKKAKSPLILLGAGANKTHLTESLSTLIEETKMYFFSTQLGKGSIDERSEYNLGCAALSAHDYVHCAIDRADLIINIGHDTIEKPPFLMSENGPLVTHINNRPSHIDEVYFPQLDVVGDLHHSIQYLNEKLSAEGNKWDNEYYNKIKTEIDTHIKDHSFDESFPMLPQRLVHLMREQLDAKDIICLDNGMYKIWFARNYKCYFPNTLILDNALATMGAGLASAMAAKIVHPERKVVAVCGDGGFMMNGQELETAVRLKLNITVIILNDKGYGMIQWKQEEMGFQDYGLSYKNPNFKQYAESFCAKGYAPTSDSDFQEILSKCLKTDGVHLIDLPVDYSKNHEILNVQLKEKTCNI